MYGYSLLLGRLHAFQLGISLKKSKEDMSFLVALMDWLEKTKQELKSHEVSSNVMYCCFMLSFFVAHV